MRRQFLVALASAVRLVTVTLADPGNRQQRRPENANSSREAVTLSAELEGTQSSGTV